MNRSLRLVLCLTAFMLIVVMFLGFAYLMRDTPLLRDILDVGSAVVLLIGAGLYFLAVTE